jgi:hypothetical protein
MRSFYSTHKNIRLFILGVPEGWQAAIYDLDTHQWIDKHPSVHESLKEAKAHLQATVGTALGKKLPEIKWHLRRGGSSRKPEAEPL